MEEEFIRNQERLKPQEEKNEEERSKVDDLRGIQIIKFSISIQIDENFLSSKYHYGLLF